MTSGVTLETYLRPVRKAFENSDRRAAHKEAAPILKDMARDVRVLPDIIRKNLSAPGFLERPRINPVLAMSIEKNQNIEFIMHGWLPLPNRSTGATHQSIHHHGNLLLTSVSAFGPGYESLLFKKGVSVDDTTREATITPDRFYRNSLHNIEIVDTDTPHVVFYPPAFSITYALWSTDKQASRLKQLSVLRKYKKQLKQLLELVGLARQAGVNVSSDLDFYLHDGKVLALKERAMYPQGSNENFVQNLFHVLQVVGFDDDDFIRSLPEPNEAVRSWKRRFLERQVIPDCFEAVHLDIAKVNLDRQELLRHFGLQDEPEFAAAA